MKRKSVTLPDVIFELINRLSDEHQLLAYQVVFRAMFFGKELEYDGLPSEVQNVLIVAKYELRKMQTKYENGCVKKTIKADIPFACKNELSETNQNKAKESARARNISSNTYNKNIPINSNINNKLRNKVNNCIQENKLLNYNNNQSICLSEENDDEEFEEEFDDETKISLYLQNICEQIHEYDKLTKFAHTNLCGRFEKMIRKLSKSSKPIGIGDDILLPVQILNKISGAIPKARELGSFMKSFNNLCKLADNSNQIKNKYRYLIASIYNEIQGI